MTSHLHQISGREAKFEPANGSSACGGSGSSVKAAPANASQATLLAAAHGLKDLGPAPEFTETQDWFNTPAMRPLSLSALHGRVVLVDFWTYTCINCLRTLPYLKAWDAAYRRHGLTIVGVRHRGSPSSTTPLTWPTRCDQAVRNTARWSGHGDMGTWNAYGNQYWPADYLIDAGHVRNASFGEGDYARTETAIRALLAEASHDVVARAMPPT